MDTVRSAELLVRETNSLISLPDICLKLRKVLDDPEHDRKEITNLIKHDPALVARLLRIVNSAYFGLQNPVRDIPQALSIIGEEDLNYLIIVTAIVKQMNKLETRVDINSFWKSSILSAVLARNIGIHCKSSHKEEMFLAGLLLNIGRLLLYSKEPELYQEVRLQMEDSNRSDYEIEKEILGFDHCDVGAVLAREWRFSDLLLSSISQHHIEPENFDEHHVETVMYLVSHCCDNLDLQNIEEKDIDELNVDKSEILSNLKIENEEFTELLRQSHQGYLQAYETFCGAA